MRFVTRLPAVERTGHIQDSQGQILALAFRHKSLKPFKLLPLRLNVGALGPPTPPHPPAACQSAVHIALSTKCLQGVYKMAQIRNGFRQGRGGALVLTGGSLLRLLYSLPIGPPALRMGSNRLSHVP